jgi:glycerol-3-phosphate acyltransferase PlsY
MLTSYLIPVILASYVIGSIPFGVLVSRKLANTDISRRGSGNIGATNVARELGLKWGLVTLILDLLKGFVPVYLFCQYSDSFPKYGVLVVCLSPLLGHQFSLFRGFHGGKGVATALGIFLAISPVSAVMSLCAFVLTVYLTDFVSLGSIIGACFLPLILFLFGASAYVILGSMIMCALICIKHKDNICRLVKGKERKWRQGPSC